ncbi:MAG: hypothetical protein ACRYFS_14980 [Janthinobacterium lividum]
MAIEYGVSETDRRQVHQGKNVQFLILSRRLAATRTLEVPYAVISITDSHASYPDAEIASSPLRRSILRLRFDDTPPGYTGTSYQPFSKAMAEQIVRFVSSNVQSGVKGIIVHCAQGISRSSAVAVCLSAWLNGEEADFFDDYFSPNARVREIMRQTIAVMEPEGISRET